MDLKNQIQNREIKFRAWDESQNYMAYQGTSDLESIQSFMHHFGDKTLMQFTGLHDKNGKEIYEGDVLNFGNNNHVEVKFENGAFTVFSEPLGWDFDSEDIPILTDFKYCEIIGNIFENADLVKL